MGCVKLGEKDCIDLPSVGEQTAKLPNFTQPMGWEVIISGPVFLTKWYGHPLDSSKFGWEAHEVICRYLDET